MHHDGSFSTSAYHGSVLYIVPFARLTRSDLPKTSFEIVFIGFASRLRASRDIWCWRLCIIFAVGCSKYGAIPMENTGQAMLRKVYVFYFLSHLLIGC